MKFRRLTLVAVAATLAYLLPTMFFAARPSIAMPEFAQATGLQCSACHTMVPLLNSYGRYVQRTGYAAIDRSSLDKTFPIWIGESLNTDSTAGAPTGTPVYDFGNLAVHAIGYAIPQVTYHIQQWLIQNNQAGGLDSAWVAYNHVFTPDLHLFAGKILTPAPSIYSQNSDIDGPMASSTVVGEHSYASTYGNRWGTKLAYTPSTYTLEAGYVMSGADLNGISDFGPNDKTFMWKAALAQVKSPLEFGVFGTNGSLPVTTGTDFYNSQAVYAQLDPGKHYRPGALVIYQTEHDSNPGADGNGVAYGPTQTYGLSYEIFESLLNGNMLLTYRHDMNNSQITGGYTNGNAVNLAFNVPIYNFPYLHGYVEANLGGNSSLTGLSGGPQWKGMLWLTVPVVFHPQ